MSWVFSSGRSEMDSMMVQPTWRVSLSRLADLEQLAGEWRTLEPRCRGGFFRSWDWIGALLRSLPASVDALPDVLRVHHQGELAGLGLWWRGRQQRHGFVRSRTCHLNETGNPELDRITIEHNGLLARIGDETQILHAALKHLQSVKGWDELVLSGIQSDEYEAWQQAAHAVHLQPKPHWRKTYFFVDLAQVRKEHQEYLEALSSNTRYQVRRALRLYAQQGALKCEVANSTTQALNWLGELMALHQAQWDAKGEPGAFGSEFTRTFHHNLVATAMPGRVWMTRLSAGEKVVGYLYNFERDGIVYNYQAGHIAETDSKLKPGLVCHALAIEDALQKGCVVYDFMMGGGHFKSSLTNAEGSMVWAAVQRPLLVFKLEDWLRQQHLRLQAVRSNKVAAP